MATEVTVTQNVTTVEVGDSSLAVSVSPLVTTIEVAELSIGQSTSAGSISVTPNDDISSTNVQAAIETLAARNEITSDERSKLEDIEAEADVTDTENVVSALTAGTNISIDSDGTVNANVLGALTAGTNITIGDDGTISASSVSLTDVYTADSQTAHLELEPTPNQGDVVIRSDENKTYIHNGGTTGTMADYTELASNTNGVQSINDATGVVTFGKSNLSDYSANEFIDWTVSQESVSLDIHADNYINTTYTAGNGISISDENVISATGSGGGGTTFTASGNLILDNGTLDTKEDVSFKKIKLLDDDGTQSGIFIKAFQNTGGFSGLTDGLAIYKEVSGEADQLVVGLLQNRFVFTGDVTVQDDVQCGAVALTATTGRSENLIHSVFLGDVAFENDPSYEEPFIPTWDNSKHRCLLGSNVGTITRPQTSNDHSIATTAFVQNAITASGGVNIPDHDDAYQKYITKDSEGVFRTQSLDITPRFKTTNDAVHLKLYDDIQDREIGDATAIINAGTGVTITTDDNYQITISANPDGLPTQSASTEGYVLTSNDEVATWLPITTAAFPTQGSDTLGKFLQSNGATVQWSDVDALPTQSLNTDGYFLKSVDGEAEWAIVDALPDQDDDTYNKFLASSSSGAVWADTTSTIPTQTDHSGKFLTTNGSALSWSEINTAGQTGSITFSSSTISSSASDTVTVDDKLTATGSITAPDISLTGAGDPSVTSVSSFKVTAPDGFYVNNKELLDSNIPSTVGSIDISSGFASFSNVDFFGSHSISATALTNDGFKYLRLYSTSLQNLGQGNYNVEVEFQEHSNTPPKEVTTNVSISDNGYVYIALRCNGGHSDLPSGRVLVKIYVP